MNQHIAFNPGFPIYLYEEGMQLPSEGTYYVVAGNGTYLHKDTGILRCFIPVENISILADLNADARLVCNLPKIPAQDVYRVKHFFAKVVQDLSAEAIVLIYYNKEKREFLIEPSVQVVNAAGLKYLRQTKSDEGYLMVGTIHSHCDFESFHSGVDVGDEEYFDGLHCTFGHNNREIFTISVSIVINGYRTPVDPTNYLEGIEAAGEEHRRYGQGLFPKHFRLIAVDEVTHFHWTHPVSLWEERVKRAPAPLKVVTQESLDAEFDKGDQVTWRGELGHISFKTLYGSGPFKVLRTDGQWLMVHTNVGPTMFSSKLFTHALDEVVDDSENEED